MAITTGRKTKPLARGFLRIFETACALSVPILAFIAWRHTATNYPRDDEGDYFSLASEFFFRFKSWKFSDALSNLYIHRHFKPILLPVLGTPFLSLTEGDARLAITIACFTFLCIWLSFSYKFARRLLNPFSAVLVVWLLGVSPWGFGATRGFDFELPLMAASTAGFYFLTSERPSIWAGFWISVSVCLRPIETILMFGLPVLSLFIVSVRREKNWPCELGPPIAWLILGATVFWQPMRSSIEWTSSMIFNGILPNLLLCAVLTVAFVMKCSKVPRAHLIMTLPLIVAVIWFLPGAATLYYWIFLSNFGSMAQSFATREGTSFTSFVLQVLRPEGLLPFLLLALGISAALFRKKVWCLKPLACPLVFSLLMVSAVVLSGSISINGDARYYFAAMAMFTLVAATLALLPSLPFQRFRMAAAILLLLLELVGLSWNFSDHELGGAYKLRISKVIGAIKGSMKEPLIEDSMSSLYSQVVAAESDRNWLKTEIIELPYPGDESKVADPGGLNVIAVEKGPVTSFSRLAGWDRRPPRIQYEDLLRSFDFILIGPFIGSVRDVAALVHGNEVERDRTGVGSLVISAFERGMLDCVASPSIKRNNLVAQWLLLSTKRRRPMSMDLFD